MRAILAITLLCISFTLVACAKLENDRSQLMGEAMECCNRVCSAKDYQILTNKFKLFAVEHGKEAELEVFLDRVLSGDICHTDRKAARADRGVGITCSRGPFDVANYENLVNCTVSGYHPSGIRSGSVSAYGQNGGSVSYTGNSGYIYTSDNTTLFWDTAVTLQLKQFSPCGAYTVNVYIYGYNDNNYYYAVANFNVSCTVNDNTPPVLTAVSVPAINFYDFASSYLAFTATDDRSGVYQVQATIYNATASYGYAYWNAPYINGRYIGQTPVSASAQFYFYTIPSVGKYNLTFYLYDLVGRYKYLYPADLINSSLPYSVVVDQSICSAGKFLAYGQIGSCNPCPWGSYSPNFAFRCKACPPGTGPNVTGCAPCPAGSYGVGGSLYCAFCPAGYYSPSAGASVCQPCNPGTYGFVGATSCNYCPSGTYSNCAGESMTACTPCAPGTASSYSYSGCSPCQAGYYAPGNGTSYCSQCPAGSYTSKIGAVSCDLCPTGQSSIMGSNSVLNCA